jgi:hypothetical protein
MGTSASAGDAKTMSNGMAAPIENVAADVSAACTGRAVESADNPELIARVGAQGIFRHQLPGDQPSKGLIDITVHVEIGKLIKLEPNILAQTPAVREQAPLVPCRIAS